MNVLPKFLSSNGDKQMADAIRAGELSPNEARGSVGLPPILPARQQPRQYSEVAAQAAQHVHDLEMMIESLRADVHALTARLTVAEERARVIQGENEFLMKDRDYHKERCVRIETKLNSAAQLILDAMTPAAKPEEQPETVSITMADLNPVASGSTTYDPSMQATNTAPEPPRNGNGKRKTVDPKTPQVPSAD